MFKAQSHNTNYREHVCRSVKRIFPTIKLRPQTPPVRATIDKRAIGDAAIPKEFTLGPSSLGSLANEREVSSDVTL